ncbi:MAG: J domain-containing protein [Synergistales bacterium]|nr:J domain-containing protein [Synergistales bacterium]
MNLESQLRTLGLEQGATMDEVRAAFRRLARTCHPDVAGPGSSRRFQEIAAAYVALRKELDHEHQGVGGTRRPGRQGDVSEEKPPRHFWKGAAEPFVRWLRRRRERSARKRRDREAVERRSREREKQRRIAVTATLEEAKRRLNLLLALDEAERAREQMVREAALHRLRSKHPRVRLLALGTLVEYLDDKKVVEGVADLLTLRAPEEEELLLLLARNPQASVRRVIARALAVHGARMETGCAFRYLGWIRMLRRRADLLEPLLDHPSPDVRGKAISLWERDSPLPGLHILRPLLQSPEKEVLVPLLHLLRNRECPPILAGSLRRLAAEHQDIAVRTLASSLVSRGATRYNTNGTRRE